MSNYQVEVHGPTGEQIEIDLCNTEQQMKTMKVQQLKEKIKEKLPQRGATKSSGGMCGVSGESPHTLFTRNNNPPRVLEAEQRDRVQASGSLRNQRMGKIYQVVVHGLRGEKMTIDLCNTEEQMKTMTVQQLKEKIAEKLPQSGGEEALRLIFTDKMLDGDFTLLSEYGIQHMSRIQMALRVPGGETA